VIAAIRKLFPEIASLVIGHIATGFLTLTTGKMSSRKGNVLTGEDLLNEMRDAAKERAALSRADDMEVLSEQIAVAALKFQILKGGTGKNIVFDKEKAVSFEGDSGPYLQYTHARTSAILEKARESGIEPRFDTALDAPNLARLAYRFYDNVLHAQAELEPHIIATYLVTLAAAFNSWYAQEQILDGTDAAAHKVAIVDIVRQTLKNGLWLLGIPSPEKM
jgi:arginyl-tRNA synthetase